MHNSRSLAHSHVHSCIFSESEYTRNCDTIFFEASKNSKQYIQDLLTSIFKTLNDRTYAPLQKFLALQVLVNTSETNNRTLMKTLAASKDYLNKLFHDAQSDKHEPLESKGTTFFSPNPSTESAKLGKKYVRLVLEAFVYWDSQYGALNPNDPLHCYYVICDALAKQTEVPKSYSYVGKNSQVQKYRSKAAVGQSNENQDDRITEKMKTNEPYWQLMRCISSEEKYNSYSSLIFDQVERASLDYNKNLLEAITDVLVKTSYTQTSKFYSMYLLAQISETRDRSFMSQLGRESDLLNQIYKQGKNDDSRGDWKSEEASYKKKLDVITLELVKFWYLVYGTNDIKSPFYSFTHLYNNLLKVVDFPDRFYYIKSSPDSLVNIRKKDRSIGDDSSIMRLVKQYIASGLTFRDDWATIPSILLKQGKEKSIQYLEGTHEILTSSEIRPNAKFYALYLLLKVAESKNSTFISTLTESKGLLDQLVEDAAFDRNKIPEKRGAKFFSSNPSPDEAIIGCNYIQLLHEMIRFLSRNYEVDNPRNLNYVFRSIMEQTQAKLPDQDYYVGRDLSSVEDKTMKRFETIPFTQLSSVAVAPRSILRSMTMSRNEPTEKGVSRYDLEKSLGTLNHSKSVLIQFLDENRSESAENLDLLDSLVQEVNDTYKKEVHPHLQHLVDIRTPDAEAYRNIIYQEGKISNEIDQEILNYKTQKISYFELRHRLLSLLSIVHHLPAPTPVFQVAHEKRASFEGTRVPVRGLLESDPTPVYQRTQFRGRTDIVPLSASDVTYMRRNEEFGRPQQRKVNTAVLPERFGLYERGDISMTSSIVDRTFEKRAEEPRAALRDFERFGQAIDHKIRELESSTLSSAQVPNRREFDDLRSESSGIRPIQSSMIPSQDPIRRSSYLGNRGVSQGERRGFLQTSYIQPFSQNAGLPGRYEGGRELYSSGYYSNKLKLGEGSQYGKRDASNGRNYLFENSNVGGRLNL